MSAGGFAVCRKIRVRFGGFFWWVGEILWRERGRITSEIVPSELKGRPVNLYSLSVPFAGIVGEIEREQEEELAKDMATMRRIREMVGKR